MSGFCLQIRESPSAEERSTIRVVDLDSTGTRGDYARAGVTLSWSSRRDSRHWWVREEADGLSLIEGQPDRFPSEAESLDEWIRGQRWGSFRGFSISHREAATVSVLVFVDRLGTRPIYFHRSPSGVVIADKIATIALNSEFKCDLNWPAVLESITLGSLYTFDTTLDGVEELCPGQLVCFYGTKVSSRYYCKQSIDKDIDADKVRENPAEVLLCALRKAIAETWNDSSTWLLLSGGLDSRFVLALAGPGRKALTINLYETETAITRDIATCCGADFRVISHLASDFVDAAELAIVLTGAMHDAHFFTTLGMGARLRANGISGVTHAYLFDTLLKGYLLLPAAGGVRSLLSRSMPRTARFFEWASGRGSPFAAHDVITMMSPDGRAVLHERLSDLDSDIPLKIDRGMDITFEARVLSRISRQVHYGGFLGWCEELDVSSPIFHPAVWTWYAHSSVKDRTGGVALIQAMLKTDHDILNVVDSNTGLQPRMPVITWQDLIRRNPLYRRLLQPMRRAFGKSPEVHFNTGLGDAFRERLDLLEDGLAEMKGHELFDAHVMESYRKKFVSGEDRYLEPLLACASVARWWRLVRERCLP